MAAAWPYCDAVVSAHNFESLDDLLTALRAARSRPGPQEFQTKTNKYTPIESKELINR
jgi:hypothetical protein